MFPQLLPKALVPGHLGFLLLPLHIGLPFSDQYKLISNAGTRYVPPGPGSASPELAALHVSALIPETKDMARTIDSRVSRAFALIAANLDLIPGIPCGSLCTFKSNSECRVGSKLSSVLGGPYVGPGIQSQLSGCEAKCPIGCTISPAPPPPSLPLESQPFFEALLCVPFFPDPPGSGESCPCCCRVWRCVAGDGRCSPAMLSRRHCPV